MTTGSGKPALGEPADFPHYDSNDADVITVERLAAALSGRYTVRHELGHGGAAFVYLAHDLVADRPVAIKVLRPELAAAVGEGRFHREIDIARRLHHDNIVPLLDSGSIDGLIFFTMPYIEGDTLRTRIRKERQLPLADAIAIARAVASALDYAHQNGVVHRDIKPANILLSASHTYVADFGIARAMTVAPGEEVTSHSGLGIGTLEYMSPEQALGQRDIDARCDVYALGCVVYQMLVGEPPFTGPTAQAIIARHCHEPPHSIRVIRPAVPIGVERAITKALAKVPADRYPTAGEFIADLDAGVAAADDLGLLGGTSRRTRVLLTTAVLGIAAATWYATRETGPPLDSNRVVVFPLQDRFAPGSRDAGGEGVATFIGYALEGTRPLKWLDGWEVLDSAQRLPGSRLESREGRRLSAGVGAGFYIDGAVVRRPDSVTVILKLYDVAGDSVVRVAGRSARADSASIPQLGLAAVSELLPALVAPGGKIDFSLLANRKTTAVANFLQGEREYRRMRFHNALRHYQSALNEDSAFTLAAVRGAYAANWLSELEDGVRLSERALRDASLLQPAQVFLARGLHAYLVGSADSAVQYLRRALETDSTVHAGWTLLGEVYSRLLPSDLAADSLTRDALRRARDVDHDFAPNLLLLEEIAFRDANVSEVVRLRAALGHAGADTTHQLSRELMLKCVRDGAASVDWATALRRDQASVLSAGKLLGARASKPECAIASFTTIVEADSVPENVRWGAFVGLQTQLTAVRRRQAGARAFSHPGVAGLPRESVYLLVAAAGGGFERDANAIADSMAGLYATKGTPWLWHLGSWEARRRNVPRVREISRVMQQKASLSGTRTDRLLSRAIAARLRLLEGDSVGALRLLRSLAPSARRNEIAWQPWESLGPERLVLAQLLFARGELEEARKVATWLDATEPVTYPLYLRESLELRARIAVAMKDRKLIAEYQRRLKQLS